MEKSGVLPLNKLESYSSKNDSYQVWLKLAHWFWSNILKISTMYFRYFAIISPWKMARTFLWTHWISLHSRMPFAMSGWNLSCGSGGEDFYTQAKSPREFHVKFMWISREFFHVNWAVKVNFTWIFSREIHVNFWFTWNSRENNYLNFWE